MLVSPHQADQPRKSISSFSALEKLNIIFIETGYSKRNLQVICALRHVLPELSDLRWCLPVLLQNDLVSKDLKNVSALFAYLIVLAYFCRGPFPH